MPTGRIGRKYPSDPWPDWTTQYNITASNNTMNYRIWNDNWTTSATTPTYVYNNTWETWNRGTFNQVYYDSLTWNNWVVDHEGRWLPIGEPALAAPAGQRFGGTLLRSEEEWTVIREEQDRLRRQRDALQKDARAEARKLMAVVLSAEQMAQYERDGYFEVVGSEGGVFRIYHGTSGNLKQVVDGKEINALCVHPRLHDHRVDEGEGYGYLPTEDSMIAQAFALMHDELGTVQTANVHRGVRHLAVVREAA